MILHNVIHNVNSLFNFVIVFIQSFCIIYLPTSRFFFLFLSGAFRAELVPSAATTKHSILNAESVSLTTTGGRKVTLLKLPSGSDWLFLDSNILFVRDFYEDFFTKYIGEYAEDAKLMVAGSRGIGKSSFGLYCIYRALRDGKTVVYHCNKRSDSYFIFKGETVAEVSTTPTELLKDLNTLYLVDALTPIKTSCPTVHITAPTQNEWTIKIGEYHKFFGSWDRDNELDLLRQHCFPHVSLELYNEQIIRWGKIPSVTLTNPSDPSNSEASLKDLIELIDLDQDFFCNRRLVHHLPILDFKGSDVSFASSHVADLVYEKLEEKFPDILEQLCSEIKSSVNSQLFERHARNVIQMGGTFSCRTMSNNKKTSITIAPLTTPSASDKERFQPTSKKILLSSLAVKEAGVDFVIVDNQSMVAFNASGFVNQEDIMDSLDGLFRLSTSLNLESLSTCPCYFLFPERSGVQRRLERRHTWNTSSNNKSDYLSVERSLFPYKAELFLMSIPWKVKAKRQLHTMARLALRYL